MISFIIPAHNEEQLLGRTLQAVQRVATAVGQPFEMIVVSDASTDRTADVAREHGARVVVVEHRQIAKTRNTGAREAKGQRMFFVDADTEPTEAVVRAALNAMDDGAVGGGSGFRFDSAVPLAALVPAVLLLHASRVLKLACGCFVFAKKDAFEESGGFDETLFAAEEWAVSRRLRRVGKFVVLKEYVVTSARKMRTHSAWEILSLLGKVMLFGPKVLRKREGLELWYGERRIEPVGK